MRTIIKIACCVAIFACVIDSPKTDAQVVPTYELYSWEKSEGIWNFYLVHTTNRQQTPEEVFNDKTVLSGIGQLKKAISKLPRSARIVWFDRLTLNGVKLKGSEQLKYPSKEIIDEVKRYAGRYAIKISGVPE